MDPQRAELEPGLYEQLISERIASALRRSETAIDHFSAPLDPADSYEAFTRYIGDLVRRALRAVPMQDRVKRQAEIANKVISLLQHESPTAIDRADDGLVLPPEELHAVASRDYSTLGSYLRERPTTPLSSVALLTNSRGEPAIGREVSKELESADEVDLLCAFVRWTGVRVIRDALRRFFDRGGRMRVLTTTYMAATEREAIDILAEMGADVRIAYEVQSTRLHAKAWLFKRRSGFTTGFVGSSNLTYAALVDGVEWNVRISSVQTPSLIDKFSATFDTYFTSDTFEPYDPRRDGIKLATALARSSRPLGIDFASVDIHALPHQERILDELHAERERHGHWRNLVVAATGTGKTVVAALDYRRLRNEWGDPTLLFVAHRREILQQSLMMFRAVLRDGAFGERYVDGEWPRAWSHVFASIQSLTAYGVERLDPRHFDIVIVDEFHHAAAATYRKLLDHLTPKVLVGLTATPERADGEDITERFDGRIAAELRLWEALEEDLLVPFQYFGVHDDVSLESLEWKRGGYSISELEGLYTGNDARVAKILHALDREIADVSRMRALGFCVSVAHAEYMARKFTDAGIPAEAVSASSSSSERDDALRRLRARQANVIFAVDLFNEGVDVPEIDTVLFLRPTESATVFLQQLGRGLRKAEGKACLTVLDFIGQQHRRFRFDQRFQALTGASRREVAKQVEDGFPFLPAGCHISLDEVAQKVILDNIKEALGKDTRDLARELEQKPAASLSEFLRTHKLDLADVYRSGRTWSALKRAAGLSSEQVGPREEQLGNALARMLHIDDPERLAYWRDVLNASAPPLAEQLSARQKRLLAMLHFDLWGSRKWEGGLHASLLEVWPNRAIRGELIELLEVLDDQAKRIGVPLDVGSSAPLYLHCRYTRNEALAALGVASPESPKPLQAGIWSDQSSDLDVFFVTLKKSEREYSPTTMYRDYAISRTLFHWESQSQTRVNSRMGKRLVTTSRPLIFAREQKVTDNGETMAYLCLGRAAYMSHEREQPIAITWRLDYPMPADFYEVARVAAG